MSAFLETINRGLDYLAKDRARRELLMQSDRFLDDVGLSRDLLEAGVRAWPWRIDVRPEETAAQTAKKDFFDPSDFISMGLASKRQNGVFG